jgi:zinc transporter, ZIP family
VAAALGWGALAASSLVVGALVGIVRPWPRRAIGAVLAFGAGALIAAVSFELAEEGARLGGLGWVAAGLAVGALAYFAADRMLDPPPGAGSRRRGPSKGGTAGTGLALGAFLDGIPEQLVLGIGLAAGGGVSVGLLVAIFVSNLPEAIGSASDMRAAGRSDARLVAMWCGVAAVCFAATVLGYALADVASGELKAAINGFAAGALIVMLVDQMVPEAAEKAHRAAGLMTTLGFAIATALSTVT